MAQILLACHQFFPRYYTGTETLTLEVAEELSRRHHKVGIITTEPILPGDSVPDEAVVREEEYENFPVWKLYVPASIDPIERLNRESYEEHLRILFSAVLDKFKPDVVLAFHLMRLTLNFVRCIKERNIPMFFTATDFWLVCPTYQLIQSNDSLCKGQEPTKCFACLTGTYSSGMEIVPLRFKMAQLFPWLATRVNKSAADCYSILKNRMDRSKEIMELLDGVIWANGFIKDVFHENGLSNKNECIVPFPLPKRSSRLLGTPQANLEGPLKVAFIGTLRHSKGPQVLLQACKILVKQGYSGDLIQVEIWGSADNKEFEIQLKEIVKGVEWIRFCGTFPQEKFPDVLEHINVVVIPSLWFENTPLTALSALAASRVLIVSNLGGLSSTVENQANGFTFTAGEYRELAEILAQLANDKDLVRKMSMKSITPNSIEKYVDDILNLFPKTLNCEESI